MPTPTDALLAALAAAEPASRAAAAEALGEGRDPAAIGALIAALDDPEAIVRRAAAKALGAIGRAGSSAQRTAWAVLEHKALADADGGVRAAAAAALGSLAGERPPAATSPGDDLAAFRAAIAAASPEQIVELLARRGRRLPGRPLPRAIFVELGRSIGDARIGDRLIGAVHAATRREHLLRALRLARSVARPRGRASPAGAGVAILASIQGEAIDPFEYDPDSWRDGPFSGGADPRLPGVLAVSPLQELVEARTRETTPVKQRADFGLRARVGEAAWIEIQRAVRGPATTPPPLPDELRAILDRHALAWLVDPGDPPLTLGSGPDVAAIALLQRHDRPCPEHRVDWAALRAWLAARLDGPPPEDPLELEIAALGFHRFVLEAPRAEFTSLSPVLDRLENGWLPLLPWLWARRRELQPEARALLHRAHGSTLVLHDLRHNLVDLRHLPPIDPADFRALRLSQALLVAAGTLRRMDYPELTVVARPAISLVAPPLVAELVEMARDVAGVRALVETAPALELLAALFARAENASFAALPPPVQARIAAAVEAHAVAYALLRATVFAGETVRIRRKHVRRFLAEKRDPEGDPLPEGLAALRIGCGVERVAEGLVHALLEQIHATWTGEAALHNALKEGFIHLGRDVASAYAYRPVDLGSDAEEPGPRAQRLVDHLLQQLVHAPLELGQELGISHEQGLPRLAGGHLTAIERRLRRVLRAISGSARVSGDPAPGTVFTCRPISKLAALNRGALGHDCSTYSVPLRALSPHHVYYGIFEGETQRDGYMTVFEAWAVMDDGERRPVLCLETINVLVPAFDCVQEDLLVLFEAVAARRGLHPGLVLITGIGTWNYKNGWLLAACRRFRQGRAVELQPADPVSWRIYEQTTWEGAYYSAFTGSRRGGGDFRLLGPLDPELDVVQPENLLEAQRLRSGGRGELLITARSAEGPIGFISEYPEIF